MRNATGPSFPRGVYQSLGRYGKLRADTNPADLMVALADAYAELRQVQHARQAMANIRVKDRDELIAALRFIAECCGKRESMYDLTGSDGIKLTMAGMLKQVIDRVRSLLSHDEGIVQGRSNDTDPLEGFWEKPEGQG